MPGSCRFALFLNLSQIVFLSVFTIYISYYDVTSGGAEVVGALRTTWLLGAPVVNKFQDPETKTLTMSFLRISLPCLKKILNFNTTPE